VLNENLETTSEDEVGVAARVSDNVERLIGLRAILDTFRNVCVDQTSALSGGKTAARQCGCSLYPFERKYFFNTGEPSQ
jgi:hypothetical protein